MFATGTVVERQSLIKEIDFREKLPVYCHTALCCELISAFDVHMEMHICSTMTFSYKYIALLIYLVSLREAFDSSFSFIADRISSMRLDISQLASDLSMKCLICLCIISSIERTLLNRLRSFIVVTLKPHLENSKLFRRFYVNVGTESQHVISGP